MLIVFEKLPLDVSKYIEEYRKSQWLIDNLPYWKATHKEKLNASLLLIKESIFCKLESCVFDHIVTSTRHWEKEGKHWKSKLRWTLTLYFEWIRERMRVLDEVEFSWQKTKHEMKFRQVLVQLVNKRRKRFFSECN